MKQLKFLLIALFTFGAVSFGQAQFKIAHINSNELIEAMLEFQNARSQMNKLQNSYKSKIEEMYKELEDKSERYEAQVDEQTPEENERREMEFYRAKQRI